MCRENDEARTPYIMEDGTVAVEIEVGKMKRIPVCTVSNGGVFGWSCLVPLRRLTATVTSLKKSIVLGIDGAKLRQLCIQESTIGFTTMQNISGVASSRLKNLKMELVGVIRAQPEVSLPQLLPLLPSRE